jgi:hypothetical protein
MQLPTTPEYWAFQYGHPALGLLVAGWLTLLLWWVQPRGNLWLGRIWWLGWGLKLGATAILCVLATRQYDLFNDINVFFISAEGLWQLTLDHPALGWELWTKYSFTPPPESYWQEDAQGHWPFVRRYIFHVDEPRTFSFVKIVAVFYALGGGNFYATSMLFAAFGFWGFWQLGRLFGRFMPGYEALTMGVVLLMPTPLVWTAGAHKETWVLGAGALALALGYAAARLLHQRKKVVQGMGLALGAAGLLGLVLPVRPFWVLALVAAGAVVGAGIALVRMRGMYRWAVAALAMCVLGWILILSPFRWERVVAEVVYLRQDFVQKQTSGRAQPTPQLSLAPTDGRTVLRVLPEAAFVALYRPWPGEVRGPLGWATGLERALLLLGTLGLVVWCRAWRGLGGRLRARPWALVLLGFALPYAALLGVSTPFYGTLLRYSAGVWPLWALAVLGLCLPLPKQEGPVVLPA